MAANYYYIIQNAQNDDYLTPSSTWNPDVEQAQTYATHTLAKAKIDTLGSGYYVIRYVGIVS